MRSWRATWGLLLLTLLISTRSGRAQQTVSLPNVPDALATMSGEVQTLNYSRGSFTLPPGGHLQGVQMRYDPAGMRHLALLSHDSDSVAYLLVVEFPAASPGNFSAPGRLIHLHKLPSDGRSPPLRHAGGIQIAGDILAVGVEDNQAKTRSQVQFWDISNPGAIAQLEHLTIERASDQSKEATAGAVGIVATSQGHLLAVANWDSRAVDFYQSNGKPLADPACKFEKRERWTVAGADKKSWIPDTSFGTYQAINLVADAEQRLYLLGFDTAPASGDVVDLYSVEQGEPIARRLRKLARQPLRLSDWNHFRFAGGAWIHDGRLVLLSSPRNVATTTTLNVAQ
jgi:hypothetical protein